MSKKTTHPQLDNTDIFLKSIADINRYKILLLLSQGEQCVCNIDKALGLPQNLVSHHLKILKDAGLVSSRRDKNWRYYRSNKPLIKDYLNAIEESLSKREEQVGNECR